MEYGRQWLLLGLIVALVPLWACSDHSSHAAHAEHPAHIEHIDGTELSRVTFTEKAMERVGVETTTIREERLGGTQHRVVPYSSLIYDPQGGTWIYTSPKPRTFVRAPVDVYRIEGDRVFLRDGPPVGTVVASVGVAEIYGSEFEVGH
jgi:hypothetical protein